MPIFSVVSELCRADGICARVCPANVIKGHAGQEPVMRPEAAESCIACGHCMAFCPFGAARVDVLSLEEMLPLDTGRLPDAESVEMLCRSRRSIRQFKKEPVAKELLERILTTARHAPSAKNRRPVRWLAVYEREKLKTVGDCMADWLEGTAADAGAAARFPEAEGLARSWRRGLDPFFRGAPHLVLAVTPKDWGWGAVDAAISLTYVEIAALPHKVGACWAGYVTAAARAYEPLRKLLGLAEGEEVAGGQMLGHIGLYPTAAAPRSPFPLQWL